MTGDEDRLPARVLELFTHGMGGLLDEPLCGPPVPLGERREVDRAATDERDQLADQLFEEARRQL